MSLLTGVFSQLLADQREKRSSLENPQTPLSYPAEWLLDIWNGGRTDSGIRVSELTAFQVSTFLACCDLIAGAIAALPFHVYERKISKVTGRAVHQAAYDHDLYELVSTEPNDEMSSFVMRKAHMLHALAWGNAYLEVQRDAGNGVVAIWPRNPAKTKPYRVFRKTLLEPVSWRPYPVTLQAGQLCYQTTDGLDGYDESEIDQELSGGRLIAAEDILAIPGLSFDGRIGQSTVWLARQTLGLALATEKFGAKYFANYARPGGILTLPTQLNDLQKENARRSWQEAQGGENSGRVAVLPPGFEWKPMTNNPEEAQTVETRRHIRSEICAIMHVSPHMVGDIDKGRSNTEQLAQELIQYCLQPHLTAIKQEWKRKLFPRTSRANNPYFVDFDLSDMLRPDAASREKYFATGRQWGFLNANDCRAVEKLNPIEDESGEQFWMPVNMTLATTPLDPSSQDGAGSGKPDAVRGHMFRVFEDCAGRVAARDKRDDRAFESIFGAVLDAMRLDCRHSALRDMSLEDFPSKEAERAIADYLGGLRDRWAAGVPTDQVEPEFRKAWNTIRIAVYREAAAVKAKEPAVVY